MVTASRTIEEEANERRDDQVRWCDVEEAAENLPGWNHKMSSDDILVLVLKTLNGLAIE